jgi:hypothetical protein
MANLVPKLLYIGNDSNADVYTNVGDYAIIKSINVCNNSGESKEFSMFMRVGGVPAGSQNALIRNVEITGQNVLAYDTSIVVPSGASIRVQQQGEDLTFTISGVEYALPFENGMTGE